MRQFISVSSIFVNSVFSIFISMASSSSSSRDSIKAIENCSLFVNESFDLFSNSDSRSDIEVTDPQFCSNESSSDSVSDFDKTQHQIVDSNFQNASIYEFTGRGDNLHSCIGIDYEDGLKAWIPIVDNGIKPVVGTKFSTLDEGLKMYEDYAKKTGFDIRKATLRRDNFQMITLRYLVCNREGFPESKADTLNGSDKQLRSTNIIRCGCKANAKFKIGGVGTRYYILYDFEEKHNHCLFDEDCRHMLKSSRKLDYSQQRWILKMSNANIGATEAHNILCQIKGGYEMVGGSKVEFKNFQRDRNCFVGDSDANLFVRKMNYRKMYVPNYSFEYKCVDGILKFAFWADETAKANFELFGDIVSFDATFRTNKYCMVFVPFTAIDNHKNCVTLGAGILDSEKIPSYIWLLKSFLKTFGRQPKLVVTDQCPSIKQVVAKVFTESRHRFCMWHISTKLPAKVTSNVISNSDFKKRFHAIIWDEQIDATQFEERWTSLMTDFGLIGHKWLSYMYENRQRWIPSFYREIPMACLMRTTSRSESENSFFSLFFHHGANLMKFIDSFDSAMDKQRNNHRLLNHQTKTTEPKLSTPLAIEVHASKIYTRSIFWDVQNEIKEAVWSCYQSSQKLEDGCVVVVVVSKNKVQKKVIEAECSTNAKFFTLTSEHKVVHNKDTGSFDCSCLFFHHYGILCRHIFCVMRNFGVEEIPGQYIVKRWTKALISSDLLKKRHYIGERNELREKLENEAQAAFDSCLSLVVDDMKKLKDFGLKMQELKANMLTNGYSAPCRNTEETMESLLGVTKPDVIDIQNPKDIRNKGCGTGKRLKSGKEKAIAKAQKSKRLCRVCKEMCNHDSRNCPLKNG